MALILLIQSAAGAEYYADVVFDTASDGTVTISGTTNHPELSSGTSQALTSKQGEVWALAIAPKGIFSEAIYKVLLPRDSQITKIVSGNEYRIEDNKERIAIIATAENTPMQITVQYKLGKAPRDFTPIIVLSIAAALCIAAGFYLKQKNNARTKEAGGEKITAGYDENALTERQLEIMRFLEKKGHATQVELQKQTNLPKASLSRNLLSLEKKGIISKERKGMTMFVKIKR